MSNSQTICRWHILPRKNKNNPSKAAMDLRISRWRWNHAEVKHNKMHYILKMWLLWLAISVIIWPKSSCRHGQIDWPLCLVVLGYLAINLSYFHLCMCVLMIPISLYYCLWWSNLLLTLLSITRAQVFYCFTTPSYIVYICGVAV